MFEVQKRPSQNRRGSSSAKWRVEMELQCHGDDIEMRGGKERRMVVFMFVFVFVVVAVVVVVVAVAVAVAAAAGGGGGGGAAGGGGGVGY